MTAERTEGRTPDDRPNGNPLAILAPQMHDYLHYFSAGIRWIPEELTTNFPNTDHPKAEISRFASEQILAFLRRNVEVNGILNSEKYRDLMARQRVLKGRSAIGVTGCIDGRDPYIHLFGWTAGVSETMAGVVGTYTSRVDGKTRLKSPTIEQSISNRPKRADSELLEIFLAHEHCGAMAKWAQKGGVSKFVFDTNSDLVVANLALFDPGINAIERRYNSAAVALGKQPLERVGIKAVYSPETMGIELGYGTKDSISTANLARALSQSFPEYHLKYRNDFHKLERFLDKEEDVTNLIEDLYRNLLFLEAFATASESDELKELSKAQLDAVKFVLAKFLANQILSGTYIHQEAEDRGDHVHPFESHAEAYMAITIDDGLNITVGQHDPEMQVFGATVPTTRDAVEHILTEVSLLDATGKRSKPYIIFISNAVAEDMDERGTMKQARVVLSTHFNQIIANKDISRMIRSGVLVPVPVIIQNRTNQIVEIPNLFL